MPELPEVETIVQGLNRKLKNRKIVDLWTDWPKYFKLPKGEKNFRRCIIGKKIISVERRAKNVLIYLSDNYLMLVHQKMSGHLMVGHWQKIVSADNLPENWQGQKWRPVKFSGPFTDPMNRFIRLIFYLDDGRMLALSDLRRFAKVLCASKSIIFNLPEIKKLGPEPLDKNFTYKKFREPFFSKGGKIKQLLMDQTFISGIGNIYADEILWASKIHPLRTIASLKEENFRELYRTTQSILKKAVRLRGTSIDDYRDATGQKGDYGKMLLAYHHDGEPCKRCGAIIKRMKIGGRSAHFCPRCQKI
ncbi:MAG: bifunctional DNA-formamidopyrimidine glycosylase/DNA-(apurinic or apyrimidinic site) lyase [Patescibacteria group bacterium]